MRQKYGSLVWSNDASPVSANIGILAALISGAVESASSELGPSTPNRFDVVASIFAAPVTASAGSPRVSTLEQATLLPSTPPAALTAVTAGWQPAIISGPNAASGPVNGLNATTVRVECFTAPDCADEHARRRRRNRQDSSRRNAARERGSGGISEKASADARTPFLYMSRFLLKWDRQLYIWCFAVLVLRGRGWGEGRESVFDHS